MEGLGVSPETLQRQHAHQAAIAANFHETAGPLLRDEAEHVTLRSQQPRVVQDLDTFMTDTHGDLGRKILIPQSPNFGKSFLSMLCMDMAGVGTVVPETGEPMRGLFLTPTKVGIKQALKTFSWLIPRLNVRGYAHNVSLNTYDKMDVLALTYGAAQAMPQGKWERIIQGRDIFALDEIHRGIGVKTAARLLMALDVQNPTVLASTHTPHFNDEHNVANVLGIERSTSKLSENEAIYLGAANEAHLFAIYSGEEIFFSSKRGSITEEDMRPLMDRESRNKLILDTMTDMAANGRPGIVQLIPGEESLHARNIALWAKERKIIDPHTGKARHLKVEAVGNFQSKGENDRRIDAFNEGRLDALTFTKYIIETFDSPNGLGYVFGASPNGSEVNTRQFSGRGSRFFKWPTLYFSLIDKYVSHVRKRVWTFFDVFGEDQVYQGKHIARATSLPSVPELSTPPIDKERPARPNETESRTRKNPKATAELHFSESVQQALDRIPAGTVLDELLIVKGSREEIPEGYIALNDLPAVRQGLMTPEGARYALLNRVAENGRPLFMSVNWGLHKQFVLAEEAEQVIRARAFDPNHNITRLELTSFLEEQGWPRLSFEGWVTICTEAGAAYTTVSKGVHMKPVEAEKFLMRLLETPLVDPGVELAVAGVARVLGQTSTSLLRLMRDRIDYYGPRLRSRRRGISPQAYKRIETLSIPVMRQLLADSFETASYLYLQRAIGNRTLIGSVIAKAQKNLRDFYRDRGITPKLKEEAIEQFLAPYQAGYAPPGVRPPQPLDATYILSGHGQDWFGHIACADQKGADLFFPTAKEGTKIGDRDIAAAKAICEICTVKGDCLKFALDTASGGIAGGFTETERQYLGRKVHKWLKRQ